MFVAPNATAEEFERVRKNLEDIMVKQVRDLDAEFNLPMVEQDMTASEFKQMMRDARKNKKKGK